MSAYGTRQREQQSIEIDGRARHARDAGPEERDAATSGKAARRQAARMLAIRSFVSPR